MSESKESLISSSSSDPESANNVDPYEVSDTADYVLTSVEKKFLLSAERGDCAGVRRIIADYKDKPNEFKIDCVDPLNRSALISAIENENIELIRILLEFGIKVKDALLHAISEEYVEAVEMLLYHEETTHQSGQPYSWEAVDSAASTFTPDITPLILAAHRNNYEILKILLDRGASLPMPHDIRCGCDDCLISSSTDSLRYSQARINAYKALSSSSLIALSSRDPIVTAFQLSWDLRRLSRMETEFRKEYNEMRQAVQDFAKDLLDHTRTSYELEVMLNYNPVPGPDIWEPGDHQTLDRLKLAIDYKQKAFVAHPSVQQLLASIWYEGLPGFRRKGMMGQLIQVAKLGGMFPVYSTIYMLSPNSKMGQFMKKPFVKFICHSTSYATFLLLLGAASQRIEYLALEFIGTPWMLEILADWKLHERGAIPGPTECCIMLFIISLIWGEMNALYSSGIEDYVSDLWNIIDVISNTFYVTWIGLRLTAWFVVQRELDAGKDAYYPREEWDPYDPMLVSEGVFAAGMIFSFLKLVHIFSINPHLGPLQVSLGRMIIDIIKFFFIYTLVLFAFGCGLNQLLWYYADLEKQKCYHLNPDIPDFDNQEKACGIWRRFANLFETSQSLFWASFGLVDLMAFELQGIKSFTRFWAMLMFGSYSVINIIVLLNMLIAMMSNSYQIISERADTEWKFARTQLWMSYFEDGGTLPPPFNLFPTTKLLRCGGGKRSTKSLIKRSLEKSKKRHDNVMRLLVRRYITAEQRKRDDFGITEDDVMEIRQDISTLRFELIDILSTNGMKTPNVNQSQGAFAGKKGKMMERRILKDFQIGIVESIVNEAVKSSTETRDVFTSIAKAITKRAVSKKKEDWNALVRKNTTARDPIGSTRNSITRRDRRSLRRRILEEAEQGLKMDTQKIIEYNPKLSEATPGTRVAYVKFMASAMRKEQTADDGAKLDGPTKSILRHSSSKASAKVDLNKAIEVLTEVATVQQQEEAKQDEEKKDDEKKDEGNEKTKSEEEEQEELPVSSTFRPRTPILEDPLEGSSSRRESLAVSQTSRGPTPIETSRATSPSQSSRVPTPLRIDIGGSSSVSPKPSSRVNTPEPLTSRVASPVPQGSKASSPIPSTSKAVSPVPSTSKATSPVPSVSRVDTPVPSTSRGTTPTQKAETESKSEDSKKQADSTTTNEPIFKPLATEKGKSKVYGKNIGGWI